jgi:hypothetical protein
MKKVFISYSHKDEQWKERLLTHLNVPALEGHYLVWHDQDITVGSEWYKAIEKDLNEAKEIAEMGGMNLFICDYNLEAGRVWLARGEEEKAKGHFQVAKEMIDKMGYHRRDTELLL